MVDEGVEERFLAWYSLGSEEMEEDIEVGEETSTTQVDSYGRGEKWWGGGWQLGKGENIFELDEEEDDGCF